ncbi:MAG: metal-dependent transcriptional regulator [bacterium]|nr:metal-dependent transcriptional regulator [Candidatus Colisoma equi]
MAAMTQSLEDYLEAIYMLIAGEHSAQVRDVARMLAVKMPSVVKALHELKKLGLVTQQPYAAIELTAKGLRVAKLVLGRHTLIRDFLMKLGVSRKNADKDACLMEHILSAETIDRIRTYTEKQQ